MKTIKLILVAMILSLAGSTQAQVIVNVQTGVPPPWGPVNYSERYYYLPDVESYYDIRSSMFIYQSGFTWVHRSTLPRRYRNYDLYHGYKVIVTDYHGDSPYSKFKDHKSRYHKGYRGEEQQNNGVRPNDNHHQGVSKHEGKSNKQNNQHNNKGHGHNKENGHK